MNFFFDKIARSKKFNVVFLCCLISPLISSVGCPITEAINKVRGTPTLKSLYNITSDSVLIFHWNLKDLCKERKSGVCVKDRERKVVSVSLCQAVSMWICVRHPKMRGQRVKHGWRQKKATDNNLLSS